MKKTLFVAMSILLVLFAFTACEGNPSGPDDGEALVTEDEAKTLATSYFNAIDFSKLIVEASAGSTGLTVTDPASNGFTVEFKDYKGEALTANTEAKISAIKSGSIKFTFSSAKSPVTANTYTAETVAPIVFADAEEGVALTFSITGSAKISYEPGMGGIAGLTPNTTVSLSKPAAKDVTLSVGNVTVDFADIEKDITGGFGIEAEVPEDETGNGEDPADALTAATSIFDDISRAKLARDFSLGFANLGEAEDVVPGVTVINGKDSIVAKYRGEEVEGLLEYLLSYLLKGTSLQTTPENITEILNNIYDVTIEIPVRFEYYNAFKDVTSDPGHAAVFADRIKSGEATLTITFGTGDLATKTFSGTYSINTSAPIEVVTKDSEIYSIALSNFAGSFIIDGENSNLYIPNEEDTTPSISVTKDGITHQIKWPSLAAEIEDNSNFAPKTAAQTDAEYFYTHFGTKRFLNALNSAFTNKGKANNDIYDGFEISNYESISITDNSFSLEIDVDNFRYYRGSDSNQEATSTEPISITFAGTLSGETFTATSFAIKDGSFTLSDSTTAQNAKKRDDTTVTFKDVKGTIGTTDQEDRGIKFTVKDTNKISGITNYSDTYNQNQHEFNFGSTGISIELSSN